MAESHPEIQGQQTRASARTVETVEIDGLIEAWQAAMGVASEDQPRDALITKEICTEVLGYELTDYFKRKTREKIGQWIEQGLVEPVRIPSPYPDIAGRYGTTTAYRFVGEADDE